MHHQEKDRPRTHTPVQLDPHTTVLVNRSHLPYAIELAL